MKLVNFRKIKRRGEERAKNGGSTKLSVVRGGHKIDLGRRSPWWRGGSGTTTTAASLVVVGAQQDQGGGVLSPCLLQQHKATNHEAALLCTRRSGRSLKTRQGGAKGWRRRRSCKSESLVYHTVTFVVFFFCVFRDGVSAWKGVCWHESARQNRS